MATHHPRILLLDESDRIDETIREALRSIDAILLPPTDIADLRNVANDERPDIMIVDARSSVRRLSEVQSLAEADDADMPVTLVVIDTFPIERISGSRIDYLASPESSEEIADRVKWHLRFIELNKQNERLEQRLEEARRRASVGAIADGVAHNLNNVLGVIFGYLHLIKSNYRKPEVVLKHHTNLQTAVDKITEMVRRFGIVARETEPDPRPAQVSTLLEHSLERFRRETGVSRRYTFDLEPPDLSINTRFNAVEEALVEVYRNAWESYGSAPESKREIEISARIREDNNLFIQIRDRGCGIDPEIQPTMFEPFSGNKDRDGLGLTLARRCFRNLDGDLLISPNPQGGTVAEIRHPL